MPHRTRIDPVSALVIAVVVLALTACAVLVILTASRHVAAIITGVFGLSVAGILVSVAMIDGRRTPVDGDGDDDGQ